MNIEKSSQGKPMQKCLNCGDAYIITGPIIGERASKGWCTGCWNQYCKNNGMPYDRHGASRARHSKARP